jgi:hypothetical protein
MPKRAASSQFQDKRPWDLWLRWCCLTQTVKTGLWPHRRKWVEPPARCIDGKANTYERGVRMCWALMIQWAFAEIGDGMTLISHLMAENRISDMC